MSHAAGTHPKMYRNLEILGKARSGNAKLHSVLFHNLCQSNHIGILKGEGFSLQFKLNPIFWSSYCCSSGFLSAQAPEFPVSWGVQGVLGSIPGQEWLPGLCGSLGLSSALQLGQSLWASSLLLCSTAAFPSMAQLLSRSKFSCLWHVGWECRKNIIGQPWEFLGWWYLCAEQWCPDVTDSFENPNLCDARIANIKIIFIQVFLSTLHSPL